LLDMLWDALAGSLLDLNFLYYSMGLVSAFGLVLATTLAVRKGKLAGDSWWARHAEKMRSAIPAVVVLSLTTLLAGIQGGFERPVQAWHGWDFTPQVFALEGHAVEWFQDAFRHPALDYVLVTVYTVGAFSLYFTPFFILVAMGRGRSAMRIACTMSVIWAVGVVFYLFVPVYEVWTTADPAYPYHWTHVKPILFDYLPGARASWGYQTALNNNFPSLHVALSCAIAASLWLARERWLAVPATLVAAGVTVATVYLGIHWFVDVLAGLLLCAGAAWAVHKRVPREAEVFRLWGRRRPVHAEDPLGAQDAP
jgi:membrane-associated phospholipid phosphatase